MCTFRIAYIDKVENLHILEFMMKEFLYLENRQWIILLI